MKPLGNMHHVMDADMNMLAFIQMELSHGHFEHVIVGVFMLFMDKLVSFFLSLWKVKKDFTKGNIW